jgi:outer membrane protein assembly factor BamD
MNPLFPPGYHTRMSRLPRQTLARALRLTALAAFAACHAGTFTPVEASTNQSLFQAALKAYQNKNYDKAEKGFEQLTFQLPARDPLLPTAFFYLGQSHFKLQEYILAAQAFGRVPQDFPEDTLAANATFEQGRSYALLWKRPDLDADYGSSAMQTFQTFLSAYPDSPRRDAAVKEVDGLNEKFAEKDLGAAELYSKQHAYDSSIIYYRDVVARYPQTPAAKHALIGLVKAYRAIAYHEDVLETCATLRTKYPGDSQVNSTCGPAPAPAPAPAPPATTKP